MYKKLNKIGSLSLSLSLSLFIVTILSTSFFLFSKPAVAASSNDDAIVIKDNTIIIQGNTTATAIHEVVNSDAGKATNTVLFKNRVNSNSK